MSDNLNFANTNSLWGSFLAETLSRAGVRHAVVCPGSRSAPLAIAVASHPAIEATPVLDERSAAFFALGLAKRTRFPVALICTSGTAAANFYPAIIEARESRVPLLILTADRPPEMRDCASGQTIDQVKLFGHYPRWQAELALPEPGVKLLSYLRQTLRHACERALWPVAGPVHVNVPFRDPLAPVPDESLLRVDEGAVRRLLRDFIPIRCAVADATPDAAATVLDRLERCARVLIIAGPAACHDSTRYADTVVAFSQRWQAPVLADVLSPLRHHPGAAQGVVETYDRLLARGEVPVEQPDLILRLGALPTSKRLRKWVEELECPQIVIEEGDHNVDPLHSRCVHVRASVTQLLPHLRPRREPATAWRGRWQQAGAAARAHLGRALEATQPMFEGKIPWLLGRHLPPGASVFFSNSTPVRDAEFFWPAGGVPVEVYFNRGANGIDGILSTAMGVARESSQTFLVTGELAFLHDQNGLLSGRSLKTGMTVIVISNGGGGIFASLPVAQFDPPFTDFFLTPQHVNLALLCQAHGVVHERLSSWDRLVELIREPWRSGVRVIEICTDARADRQTRSELLGGEGSAERRRPERI